MKYKFASKVLIVYLLDVVAVLCVVFVVDFDYEYGGYGGYGDYRGGYADDYYDYYGMGGYEDEFIYGGGYGAPRGGRGGRGGPQGPPVGDNLFSLPPERTHMTCSDRHLSWCNDCCPVSFMFSCKQFVANVL